MFNMRIIRKVCRLLSPKKVELTAIDGTDFDSWQRSKHYEKIVGEVQAPPMPYAKANLFVEVKTQTILDFDMVLHREHDVEGAKRIFKRNKIKIYLGWRIKDMMQMELFFMHQFGKQTDIVRRKRNRKENTEDNVWNFQILSGREA